MYFSIRTMGWKQTIEPYVTRFPSVKRPNGHIPFKTKVMWTFAVLFIYFFLTNILIFGMATGGSGSDIFGQFRSILAGSQGSILQLGIGPIVTASIVLQLLEGGGVIDIDKSDPRDQAIYQGLQKWLVIGMSVLTAIPMVFSQYLPASAQLAQSLGIGVTGVQFLMLAQVVGGGILLLYMDEIVSKWGVGSGVGLFIIAGISQRLFGGVVAEIIPGWISLVQNGFGADLLSQAGLTSILFQPTYLLPILTTIFIFVVVVYAEATRVEIPLSHSNVSGGRSRFPIKLIYASVLPLILVRALQANIQFIGRIINTQLGDSMPQWLGVYNSNGQPVQGLFYYFSPINGPRDWMWWMGGTAVDPTDIMIRLGIDLVFMIIGGAVFAVFWVETTGMGADSVAQQIKRSGMQIPGFRENTSVMEKVVGRYIPAVTIIGGALIGFLAVLANLLGTIGNVSGTGLLLSVSITYKLYEEIAEEMMMDKYPMVRKLLGGD